MSKALPPTYRPREIIAEVCAAAALDFAELTGTARTERVVRAREAAVFLLRKHTILSYPDIAEVMARRRQGFSVFRDMYVRATGGKNELRDEIIFRAEVALEAIGAKGATA